MTIELSDFRGRFAPPVVSYARTYSSSSLASPSSSRLYSFAKGGLVRATSARPGGSALPEAIPARLTRSRNSAFSFTTSGSSGGLGVTHLSSESSWYTLVPPSPCRYMLMRAIRASAGSRATSTPIRDCSATCMRSSSRRLFDSDGLASSFDHMSAMASMRKPPVPEQASITRSTCWSSARSRASLVASFTTLRGVKYCPSALPRRVELRNVSNMRPLRSASMLMRSMFSSRSTRARRVSGDSSSRSSLGKMRFLRPLVMATSKSLRSFWNRIESSGLGVSASRDLIHAVENFTASAGTTTELSSSTLRLGSACASRSEWSFRKITFTNSMKAAL